MDNLHNVHYIMYSFEWNNIHTICGHLDLHYMDRTVSLLDRITFL